MTRVSIWPSFIIALALHIVVAAAYFSFGDQQSTHITVTGEGGDSLTVGLDNTAYDHLRQAQTKQLRAKQQALQATSELAKPVKPKATPKKKFAKLRPTITPKQPTKAMTKPAIINAIAEAPPITTESSETVSAEALDLASANQTDLQSTSDQASTNNLTLNNPTQTANSNPGSQTPSVNGDGNSGKALGDPGKLILDDETKAYIRRLMRHLQRFKHYPTALKRARIEGTPVVSFTVNQQGEITHTAIKKRSQNQALDQAAINVFLQANPLPAIPASLKRESLSMSLPIKFNLIND